MGPTVPIKKINIARRDGKGVCITETVSWLSPLFLSYKLLRAVSCVWTTHYEHCHDKDIAKKTVFTVQKMVKRQFL